MTNNCPACARRGKNWNGDEPRCAFAQGQAFNSDNWMCAAVNALRDLVYEGQAKLPPGVDYQYCSDQKYATVRIDEVELNGERVGLALWVSWYKSRGGTDAVWILTEGQPPRLPTFDEVGAVLAYYGRPLDI